LARQAKGSGTGAAAGGRSVETEREAAFRSAARHSRAVAVLKWLMPGLGVVLSAVFLVQSYVLTPHVSDVKAEGIAISDGNLVMANPKLEGFTKENRRYSMSAERAIQDIGNEGLVKLEGIGARLPLTADTFAEVVAASGLLDRNANTLNLDSEVVIRTDDGMEARLKSADIDIGSGALRTGDPVDIKLNGAHIAADSLSVEQRGKVLVFDKRVKVTIDPRERRADLTQEGE